MADPFAVTMTPDQPERDRIERDLQATLFVDAGAGSGKTTMLVRRVERLVIDAGVPLRHIAVITFTEKAAAELRDRIRRGFAAAAADTGLDPDARQRAADAVDEVDGAAISTLHGFAQRLLTEHPVEAGLPPRIEVLDEVASQLEFTARWNRFRRLLLDDPRWERPILLADACGIGIDDLRAIAVAFDDNWDLVDERVERTATDPPALLLDGLISGMASLADVVADCSDPDDKLADCIRRVVAHAERLRAADDQYEQLALLRDPSPFKGCRHGQKGNWPGVPLPALRDDLAAYKSAAAGLVEDTGAQAVRCLAAAVAGFTLDAAAARRAAGRLEFHDLLVLARQLLRDPTHGASVRASAGARYRRLLLDEFQDTDPIQLDLAVLLAADPAEPSPEQLPWDQIPLADGRLFVVGDPKQSIYRFRRADVTLYLAARHHLCQAAGRVPVTLTANFRTVAPVIDWVNETFGRLIRPAEDRALADAQPEYQPLDAVRPALPGGPPVLLLGADAHDVGTSADEVRRREAADVAAALVRATSEGWKVSDRHGGVAAARWGDCAVLLPARTSLPALTDALDRAGVPWRAETSSLVYATREIRDLLAALRAVADPSDELALVSALRSSLYGCGDDDLAEYRVTHGGRFRLGAPPPASLPADHPVVEAMAHLSALSADRPWHSPSELLDRLVRERGVLELGVVGGRPRDLWRRVRFVIDQARAWADVEAGSLRDWVGWATRQGDERSRVTETVLPETDDDSVRILTIHGAKGLEFPVTVVSGLSTRIGARRPRVQVVFPTGEEVGYKVGSQVRTQTFVEHEPIEEQLDHHERVRLLYVACTRARDHLVVSCHRSLRKSEPSSDANRTHAELLVDAAGAAVAEVAAPAWLDDGVGRAAIPGPPPGATPSVPAGAPLLDATPEGLARATDELAAVLGAAARRGTVSATTLAGEDPPPTADPGLAKQPRDLDLPPWLKGRYGTALGRAVHGALQSVDLATGGGLDGAARAQAAAEGLFGHEDRITALVRSALGADIVRTAAGADHWRELYLAAPVDGVLLEGYLDLLVRTPEGLVVADYKTGATSAEDADRRLAGYRTQGAAYALLVEAALGEPVARVVFLFLHDDGVVERDLPELAVAVAEVRSRLVAP